MKIQPLTLALTLSIAAAACGDKEEDTAIPVDTEVEDTGEEVDTADTEDTSDTEDTEETDTQDTSDTEETDTEETDTQDTEDTEDTEEPATDILSLSFDDAASTAEWMEVADATRPEASMEWADGAGNPDGALRLMATNDEEVGRAYIFQTTQLVDYMGATDVTLTFDAKTEGPLTATAFHLQTDMPGVGLVNNFDLQANGLNESTWTTFSYDFTGVDPSMTNLMVHFNFAAGAVIGSGGSVLVDNIVLAPTVE